jgi:hypothetical protein
LFRFQSTRNAKLELAIAEATPFNCSARGGGTKAAYIVTVFNLKSEIFLENLKIHVGGDDKLQLQFASPKIHACTYNINIMLLNVTIHNNWEYRHDRSLIWMEAFIHSCLC